MQVFRLGKLLDPTLVLELQVLLVFKSAFYSLRLICQLQPFLGTEDLTHALLTSRLGYCNGYMWVCFYRCFRNFKWSRMQLLDN